MTTKKIISIIAIVAVLALGAYFFYVPSTSLGAINCQSVTCFTTVGILESLQVDGTFQWGENGSVQTQQIVTTCDPIANTSVPATSTRYIFCTGVTGVTESSEVFAELATSTNDIGAQWIIVGAKASTTAGAIDFKIMNLTGTAAVPSAAAGDQFASSTQLWIVN